MLWRVSDFKGIELAELDIAPGKTTILTGVNSSGKSSIIQSLLLAAQSLHSGGSIVLNGPLVRLGDAEDLVREDAASESISFSLDLIPATVDEALDDTDLRADYELRPSQDNATLQPRKVTVSGRLDDPTPLSLSHANSRASDASQALEAVARPGRHYALHLKSLLGNKNRQLRTYVVMRGFRPVKVVQLIRPEDIGKRYRKAIELFLEERAQDHPKPPSSSSARVSRVTIIREFVRLFLAGARAKDGAEGSLTSHFVDIGRRHPYAFERTWRQLDHGQQRQLVDLAVEARQREPFIALPVRGTVSRFGVVANGLLEGDLESALGDTYTALARLSETLDDVSDRVQYLGPLRDEPRVVWNHWNELARSLPVGTRGEYSAAVLSRSSLSKTEFVGPGGRLRTGTLAEAVNEWLTYLEIGETVSARSHGKLGVGLDLAVGGRVRDLTAVGVGVSQTLPLLVGVLVAPPRSLFIVEQPELHLHPNVQARLADFLLTSRPDMAMVIETHSDSFVTRIRRRVAENALSIDKVDITFVEPGGAGSRARTLEISEFGNLSEWPAGFLTSAEEDVRAILQANIARTQGGTGGS